MNPEMHTVAEVRNKLATGQKLLLAGDEGLLRQLPSGDWIGGTIPYFMTRQGGLTCKDRIYVTELPDFISEIEIKTYNAQSIARVYQDAPAHGFSFIIIPSRCPTHFSFALDVPSYEGFAMHPLIGWISGFHLEDDPQGKAKVFNGQSAEELEDAAIVLHAKLPVTKVADIGILNMFEQGDGDRIQFLESGFSVREAYINGEKWDFAEYLRDNQLDTRLPLVADYHGAMVNTSFQEQLGAQGEVRFYNAVFNFLEYRHAKPIQNYSAKFTRTIMGGLGEQAIFSCNCFINYIHSELEGRHIDCIPGPTTFGEIAYQTLNQTMVYLRFIDLHNHPSLM